MREIIRVGGLNMNETPSFVDRFYEMLLGKGRKPSTIKRYRSDLLHFFRWMEHTFGETNEAMMRKLTVDQLQSFFQTLHEANYSHATIRRIGVVINRLFHHFSINVGCEITDLTDTETLRPLSKNDFIQDDEFERLYHSFADQDYLPDHVPSARKDLKHRNQAIVLLVRYIGLTPTELSQIKMKDVNFAQKEIVVRSAKRTRTFVISDKIHHHLITYYRSIPKEVRPHYFSDHPLFVAYNNVSFSFQYDYEANCPKYLSVRGIQEMIKEEVRRAGLRKISALHLRNQCILDALLKGKPTDEIVTYFDLTSSFSLHRYVKYAQQLMKNLDV
jgi:site-specific recombinase XerD